MIKVDWVVIKTWVGKYAYDVKLENWVVVKCYIWWKMKIYYVSVIVWDRVQVELNMYDLTKWRIIYRYKPWQQKLWNDD